MKSSNYHLNKRVISEGVATECGRGSKETRVRDFLNRFPDGEDEGGVDEGDDDVGVELVCKIQAERGCSPVRSIRNWSRAWGLRSH